MGGSKDQWEAGVWHMDKQQWGLLWTESRPSGKQCPISLRQGTTRQKRSRNLES